MMKKICDVFYFKEFNWLHKLNWFRTQINILKFLTILKLTIDK